MKNKLNESQLNRIKKFEELWPQINGPIWLIKFLSSIIPQYCVFERVIFSKNGTLLCYIPKLCYLNPLFKAILNYRLSTYE